jgi:hypothetical protein
VTPTFAQVPGTSIRLPPPLTVAAPMFRVALSQSVAPLGVSATIELWMVRLAVSMPALPTWALRSPRFAL